MRKLSHLYGEIDTDDLFRIVNNHLKVAIDEDCSKHKVQNCTGCGYMKMYNYGEKMYYCNHKDRTDDMERLGVRNRLETALVWCSVKKINE